MRAVVKSGKTALLAALRLGFTPAEIVTTGLGMKPRHPLPPHPCARRSGFRRVPHHPRDWTEPYWRAAFDGRRYALRSHRTYRKHHRRKRPRFRPNEQPKTLLSVPQIAEFLNVSTNTVRRMLHQGLQFHRVGSAIRVPLDDLYAYIRNTRK